MKEYRLGDKLPECYLPEDVWVSLRTKVEEHPDKKSPEFREEVFAYLRTLAEKYAVDENANKCMICGAEQHHSSGLCPACRKALYYRGALRQCGKVRRRGLKNSDLTCLICGDKPAQTLGMCRSCYHYRTKYKLFDNEDLKKYVEAKKKGISRPPLPVRPEAETVED